MLQNKDADPYRFEKITTHALIVSLVCFSACLYFVMFCCCCCCFVFSLVVVFVGREGGGGQTLLALVEYVIDKKIEGMG